MFTLFVPSPAFLGGFLSDDDDDDDDDDPPSPDVSIHLQDWPDVYTCQQGCLT